MKRGILVLGMISMLSTALWSIGSSESTVLDNWEYSGIRSLKIEKGSVFHIEVAGGSNKRLEARIHLPDDDSVVVHHSKRGSELLVWAEWKSGFTSWGGSALRMEFRVPEGIDLDIETSTGSVAIEGCNGGKNVRTSTGGITVKNSSGDIRGLPENRSSEASAGTSRPSPPRAASGFRTTKERWICTPVREARAGRTSA